MNIGFISASFQESNQPHLSDESDDDREDPVIPSNQLAAGDQSQAAHNKSQPPEGGSQEDTGEDDLENWGCTYISM